MERRMLLAVVLSFLVVALYSMLMQRFAPPPEPAPPPGEGAPERPEGEDGDAPPRPVRPPAPEGEVDPGEEAPGESGPAATWAPRAGTEAEVVRTVLRSPEHEVTLTSRGAAIESVRLLRHLDRPGQGPLDLVVPVHPDLLLGAMDVQDETPRAGAAGTASGLGEGPLRTNAWRIDRADEREVVYAYEAASGHRFTKRFRLPTEADLYHVDVGLEVRSPEGAAAPRLSILVASGLLREPYTGASYPVSNAALLRRSRMGTPDSNEYGIDPEGGTTDEGELRMLGARTQYFMAVAWLDPGREDLPKVVRTWATGEPAALRERMAEEARQFFADRGRDPTERALATRISDGIDHMHHAWMTVEVPPSGEAILPIYVGPVDRAVLGQEVYRTIEPMITYPGAFDILAKALLAVYDAMRSLFGSTGMGVILMTLIVRGLMMPLSIKNQLSMRRYGRKVAKLKPKLEVLKKRYGSNVRKMREEQAKLYREHGVGVPAGCLMLLLQLPIFFALFSCLRVEFTLRGASFLWIEDLAGPDRLIDLGTATDPLLQLGPFRIFSLNILPLLMVALSLWQQRLMPKPADEQQAQQMRMMRWMPILFAVILYNYTAALALYMVLSSVLAIVESRVVKRRDAEADAPPAPAAAS